MKRGTPEIKGYHAHVYYSPKSREKAARVREGLGARFRVRLGSWHDEPVGPHPVSMYQVVFSPGQFGDIVPWLMLNREGLDILVHPETGSNLADHTDHSLWLGRRLELNTKQFKRAR